MARKRKPQTPEELQRDIESHPDRGMLGSGDKAGFAVRFEKDEIRAPIPKELHRQLLMAAAALGMTKPDAIAYAIAHWVNDVGTQAMVESFIVQKMTTHGVERSEVREAVLGAFKYLARRRRANLAGVEVEGENDRLSDAVDETIPVDSMPIETDS